MSYTYEFPRPALTVDVVLLKIGDKEGTQILLIQRRKAPYAYHWAFPGGFVEQNELLEAAARRELKEETGLEDVELRQLAAFGDPRRDPRGWIVSVAFWGWVDSDTTQPCAGDDAANAAWWPLGNLPPLAFDHQKILDVAIKRARLTKPSLFGNLKQENGCGDSNIE